MDYIRFIFNCGKKNFLLIYSTHTLISPSLRSSQVSYLYAYIFYRQCCYLAFLFFYGLVYLDRLGTRGPNMWGWISIFPLLVLDHLFPNQEIFIMNDTLRVASSVYMDTDLCIVICYPFLMRPTRYFGSGRAKCTLFMLVINFSF